MSREKFLKTLSFRVLEAVLQLLYDESHASLT